VERLPKLSGERRAAAITAAALLGAAVVFSLWVVVAVSRNGAVDFYVYYMAGSLARHRHSFYVVGRLAWDDTARQLGVTHFTSPYRYPPYTAALASLLTPLGASKAMITWVVADAAALMAGAVLVGLALGGGRRVALAVATLALFGPAYHTIFDGQVNGLAFLALAVAFWGVARRRDGVAGAGVAAAAALKLTPLALLAYLAWRRRWRAVAVAGAVLALLTVVALPLTGASAFGQYVAHAYALTDPQLVNPSGANQTSTGALARLLLPTSVKVAAVSGVARAVRLAALAFSAALIVATVLITRPRQRAVAPARAPAPRGGGAQVTAGAEELLGFGMVLAATLVIGPFTWYHQFVWLLIPLMTLVCRFIQARRWQSLLALGLLVLGMDVNELLWVRLQHDVIESGVYRGLSLPFIAALVVWALTAAALVAERRGVRVAGRGKLPLAGAVPPAP
jgi:hypothetical protein